MPWFKRVSGDDPSEVEAPEVRPLEIEPLSDAEVAWVRSTVASLGEQEVLPHDIDDLGRHYDELLTGWRRIREPERPDPDHVITQIGLAFGQYIVDQVGPEWVIATGARGPEVALFRAEGDVLVYPTAMVAQRWDAGETGVLPGLARATLEAFRAPR